MVSIKLYVEGGGKSKFEQIECRKGFRRLIEKAGFAGQMPAIVAGGSRGETFRAFGLSRTDAANYPILLVDSEDPVMYTDENPDSSRPWEHLQTRDGWVRPAAAAADQVQMMVTCMETWLMADQETVKQFFATGLNTKALLPEQGLESRTRQEVQAALEKATKDCGRHKMYQKGKKSFQVLAECRPEVLKKHLPHFRRLLATLDRHLPKSW